jgi:hypothetical protein
LAHFFTLNIVNLNIVNYSSLHDDGRLEEVYHQLHSIQLVNALDRISMFAIAVTMPNVGIRRTTCCILVGGEGTTTQWSVHSGDIFILHSCRYINV